MREAQRAAGEKSRDDIASELKPNLGHDVDHVSFGSRLEPSTLSSLYPTFFAFSSFLFGRYISIV